MLSAITAVVLVTACDRNEADDVTKARQEAQAEVAQSQRETDQQIAAARREADEKIVEAQREAQEKKIDAIQDVTEERRELQQALKDARQNTKEEYLEYAQKRTRLLELQAAALKAKAAEVPAAARNEFDKTLQDIELKRRSVVGSLNDLEKETKEGWGSTKAKIDQQLKQIEKQVETIDTDAKSTAPPVK